MYNLLKYVICALALLCNTGCVHALAARSSFNLNQDMFNAVMQNLTPTDVLEASLVCKEFRKRVLTFWQTYLFYGSYEVSRLISLQADGYRWEKHVYDNYWEGKNAIGIEHLYTKAKWVSRKSVMDKSFKNSDIDLGIFKDSLYKNVDLSQLPIVPENVRFFTNVYRNLTCNGDTIHITCHKLAYSLITTNIRMALLTMVELDMVSSPSIRIFERLLSDPMIKPAASFKQDLADLLFFYVKTKDDLRTSIMKRQIVWLFKYNLYMAIDDNARTIWDIDEDLYLVCKVVNNISKRSKKSHFLHFLQYGLDNA